MDWHRPFSSSYMVTRVSRLTGRETRHLGFLSSGAISVNRDTELFESASLTCSEPIEPGSDVLRVHLVAEQDGAQERVCLGTFSASSPARKVGQGAGAYEVRCEGMLSDLARDSFEAPITIPAGSNIVETARAIASASASVQAVPSDAALTSAWTFGLEGGNNGDGGSKLDAVNALLRMAGYSSAWTDPRGTVMMTPYREPADMAPVWTFAEGPDATFLAEAEEERDGSKVANVVLAIYEDDGGTVVGQAVDDDPRSPYSTVSTGRRRVAKYRYDGTVAQSRADAKAAELLRTQQSTIRRVTLSHVRCPARVGDAVTVDWPSEGINGKFVIRTQSIRIGSAGCLTTSELRAFERRGA